MIIKLQIAEKTFILWLFVTVYSVDGDNEKCYEILQLKPILIHNEYENVKLTCLINVNKACRNYPGKFIWKKDERVVLEYKKRKINKRSKLELKLSNVTTNDSGNYTCTIQNEKFSFVGNISLTVKSGGTYAMKIIRQNTVPSKKTQLEKNRVYWLPAMNNNKLIHYVQFGAFKYFQCHYFLQTNDSRNIQWFVSRYPVNKADKDSFGEQVNNKSRYKIDLFYFDCEHEEFMEFNSGFCYTSDLQVSAVDSTIHEYYTCAIANQINATHQIIIENHQFNPDPQFNNSLEENILQFTENSTICAGTQFAFSCRAKLLNQKLILVLNLNHSESELEISNGTLNYYLNSTVESDSGPYICKNSKDEKSMYLVVVSCNNYSALNPIIAFLATIILSVIFISLLIIIRRLKVAFQLKNSNRIYVMRRIVIKDVVQNPDYISTPINSKLEISRDRVIISQVKLGEGNFGSVYRGWVDSKEVAIKIASELGQNMLSDEVQMMQQIGHHRHILELIGVCFDEGSLWAIMELASLGSLKNHLQSCNPSVNQLCQEIELDQLFVYSLQIGRGMEYLASKLIVHRDLATRNILLSENGDIKIADFGLTRIVINYYHSMSDDSRPLRWMAPESLKENRFTTKSDVWSFGIVLWEIFSLGVVPYFSLSFGEIRDAVCSGVINDQPEIAPGWIYELMKKCWRFDEDLRPKFSDIVTQLESVNINEYI